MKSSADVSAITVGVGLGGSGVKVAVGGGKVTVAVGGSGVKVAVGGGKVLVAVGGGGVKVFVAGTDVSVGAAGVSVTDPLHADKIKLPTNKTNRLRINCL